jgi:hypothetical protein
MDQPSNATMVTSKFNKTAVAMALSAKESRLANAVVATVLTQAIADREISFEGKTADQIKEEIESYLLLIITGIATIVPVADHREYPLREANPLIIRHTDKAARSLRPTSHLRNSSSCYSEEPGAEIL